MNDLEKMQKIVVECDEIKKLIEDNGDLGLSLAAALYHTAVNEQSESPSNSALVARANLKIMTGSLTNV